MTFVGPAGLDSMLRLLAFACLAACVDGEDQSALVCNATSCTAGSIFLQAHHGRAKHVVADSAQCSVNGEDCRDTQCCSEAGHDCYEKNQYWASCRQSCTSGINTFDPPEYRTPWTCARLDGSSTSTPTPTPNPSPMPSPTPSSMPSPGPTASGYAFTTSMIGSSLDRISEFVDQLTDQPVQGSVARAVHSSGGAAGGVVSEGQGYGLLLAGATFASLDSSHVQWQETGELLYELFLGWRQMCELSAASGSCQDDEGFKCGGGSYPCLPHWKFGDDLSSVIATGAAPDADADALAGMLLAVMAAQRTSVQPAWLEEVGRWAYETCVQFYESSTTSSPSGSHRIVKLGSCWGGWGDAGQNPSYHAPGVYRMCKHYMQTFDNQFGASDSEGDSYASKWDTVIDTSYKMLNAVQCPSTGLITNWAKIFEAGEQLTASTGFSGSGTPGAEYGSEASRGVWRVALDYILFPSEAGSDAAAFLRPVTAQLETKESSETWAENLDLDGNCLVNSIHASWSWNMFMAGPTFSALVSPAGLPQGRQQQLADSAGVRVASKSITDYYSGSWVAISTMTLNGDLSKAALNAGLMTAQASSTLMTSASTTATTTRTTSTEGTTAAPTPAPVPSPVQTTVPNPEPTPTSSTTTKAGGITQCGQLHDQCAGNIFVGPTCCVPGLKCLMSNPAYSSCQLDATSSYECAQLHQKCGGQSHTGKKCCSPGLVCHEQSIWYHQCRKPALLSQMSNRAHLGNAQTNTIVKKKRMSSSMAMVQQSTGLDQVTESSGVDEQLNSSEEL